MSRRLCVISFLLCAAPIGWAQQQVMQVGPESFVPAGTLLHCTLDEPNFSSRTASVGDPVLCHVSSIEMFGRPLVPRGAYLSARLEDYKDPGHFVGKGWIQLEFTSLTVPGGNVPINAKVISAGRFRVDGEGKVHGRGHATRDVVEWSIPILWPVKVLTLPARGPRPTFKGETRIALRLMEDVLLPTSANTTSGGLSTRSDASRPRTDDGNQPRSGRVWPSNMSVPPQRLLPAAPAFVARLDPGPNRAYRAARPVLTLLVLRGGLVYQVSDYWVDNDNLDYITGEGVSQILPLDVLDMPLTTRLNAERGVSFVLTARNR